MKKLFLMLLVAGSVAFTSCGGEQKEEATQDTTAVQSETQPETTTQPEPTPADSTQGATTTPEGTEMKKEEPKAE